MASSPLPYFAASAPGLEPITAGEIRDLGLRPFRVEPGGVAFGGTSLDLYRANLWLRTASRVLARLASFRADAFYELERHARKVDWASVIARGAPVRLSVTCHKSRLYHSGAVAERVLEAMSRAVGAVDARLVRGGDDDEAETGAASQLILVRFVNDRCVISADTSGELLHRRGYRQAVARAPLRETLAAAMLLACRWAGDRPLIDPMCGSGTIPVEAALLARRIAPGAARAFAFERWPGFDAERWRALRETARAGELAATPVPIHGSDSNAGAIAAATANAERAGVRADLDLGCRPFAQIVPPPVAGLVASNPPYGVRVGEAGQLRALYAELGRTLRAKCPNWRVALLAPPRAPTRPLGVAVEEQFHTSNGGIPVRLLAGTVAGDGAVGDAIPSLS